MTRTASPPDLTPQGPCALSPGLPGRGERLLWTGLGGDSQALAIANAVQAATGPLLVVTPDMQTAEQLQEQVAFFAGTDALSVITFPDWETLPYDSFSPHQDIISGRLATLYRLADLQDGLLIVSVATLLQRLPPRIVGQG